MINEMQAKKYCKEDLSKIKNYDKAIADKTHTWHCHHMTETWWNCSKKELIENECYYNRKACELIFLTPKEHMRMHMQGQQLSAATRRKMTEAKKGNVNTKGKTFSVFGDAFKEHYGLTRFADRKLYMKEYNFYKYHSKFSWEAK